MEPYTIRPTIGIDHIFFGIEKREIKDMLGNPPSQDHSDDRASFYTWSYDQGGLEFEFWKERTYNLAAIDIFESDIILFDQYIPANVHITLFRNFLHDHLESSDIIEEELDDMYEIKIHSLDIWFYFRNSLLKRVRLVDWS
ncbi:MAG: hypothetical protein OCD01_11805 [Fibrobacterales bacterium]